MAAPHSATPGASMTSRSMARRDFGALVAAALGAAAWARPAVRLQEGWTSLWNGKDFDGWTTWMQRPEPSSDVPGLAKGANGRYTEPIGSGRDPLNVFSIAQDIDGRPAI